MQQKKKSVLIEGLRAGIPIALGYLSVSFGFGVSAANLGIPTLAAVLLSLTNVTSAGQVAGISVIAAGGTLAEIALTQLVINARYALMGLSLTQNLQPGYSLPHRLLTAYGITDEIFAVAVSRKQKLQPAYMYGLISLPVLGWVLGTFLGAVAGNLLPHMVSQALGLAIYGMFVAIVLPPCKEEKGVLWCVLLAAALSCALKYIPLFGGITQGFAIILCGVAAAAVMALLFPREEEQE